MSTVLALADALLLRTNCSGISAAASIVSMRICSSKTKCHKGHHSSNQIARAAVGKSFMIYLNMVQAAYLRVGLGNFEGLCEAINVYPTYAYTRYSLMLKWTIQRSGCTVKSLDDGQELSCDRSHFIENLNMKILCRNVGGGSRCVPSATATSANCLSNTWTEAAVST